MKQPQKKSAHDHVRKVATGTLSLFTAPAKAISLPLSHHYARRTLQRKGKAQWLFWLEVCVFLFGTGLLFTTISLALQMRFQTEQQPVIVSLENEVQKNGEPYVFTVAVKNTFGSVFQNGVISLHLPPHTTILTAPEHFSYESLTLSFDRLMPGAVRTFVFSATTLEDRKDSISHPLFVQVEGVVQNQKRNVIGKMNLPRSNEDPVKIEAFANRSSDMQNISSLTFAFTNLSSGFFSPFLYDVCYTKVNRRECVTEKIPFLSPSGFVTSTISVDFPYTNTSVQVLLKTVSAEKTVVFENKDVDVSVTTSSPQVMQKPVAPNIHASSVVRYYSVGGDQLGRGVFPPEVGQSTEVWFFWHVDSIDRDVQDMYISSELPSYVTWSGQTGGQSAIQGEMTFDPHTRFLRWQAKNLSKEQIRNGIGISGVLVVTPAKKIDQIGKDFSDVHVYIQTADGFNISTSTQTDVSDFERSIKEKN